MSVDADGPRRTALGRLLQDRRTAKGYSRTRAAELAGMKAPTIESWEQGRVSKPPIHDVIRLARVLEISTAELEAAVLSEAGPSAAAAPEQQIGAVPLLEDALAVLGWTEADAAAALDTSVERLRNVRAGAAELSVLEVMTLTALIAAFRGGAQVPTRGEVNRTLGQLRRAGR